MFRLSPIFVAFLILSSVQAVPAEEELIGKCMLESTANDLSDPYLHLVNQMQFEKAQVYCDQLTKDPKNCKASSRFWLGVQEFANGNF